MNDFFKSLWWLIINVGYMLFILVIAFMVFTVPEQSDDFIYVFIQDFEIDYMIAVYSSLPIWCFITWYSSCIILQIDPVKGSLDRKDSKRHLTLSLVMPKVLGILPCIIFAYAIASAEHLPRNNHRLFHLILLASTGVAMWFLFQVVDKYSEVRANVSSKKSDRNNNAYEVPRGFLPMFRMLFRVKPIGNWPSLREVENFKEKTNQMATIKQELIFIAQFTGVRFFYLYLGSFCLVLTLLLCVPSINLALSSWLRPGAIVIMSIASFTLMFTIIAYFHDYARRPFGIIILVLMITFSYWNDNTALNYLSNRNVEKRMTLDRVFDDWIRIKKSAWMEKHPGTDMPVVLIATQGGGIRGLTWTTRIFHYLDSTHQGFMDQTFVISGVSGGGVGSTAYLSWMHDQQSAQSAPPYEKLNSFTKRDFLSPVTAAFAFGDCFQRFLPFPVSSLDRSKMLGRTWDEYYSECVGVNTFSRSFLEMWYDNHAFNYKLPSLILNGTLAENGQRIVTSNLNLGRSRWFEDDIDFFEFTQGDISRSTAALNCSRFPVITSGALMTHGSDRKGHIVDGGYRENTGMQTLLNVFSSIRTRLNQEQGIKVLVIYLQNGSDERNDKVTAARAMQDLLVPLQGLIQVNGTGLAAKSVVQFAAQTFDEGLNANVRFLTFRLESRESTEIKLPLGWYMSEIVSKEIDKRIRAIPETDTTHVKILSSWFPR